MSLEGEFDKVVSIFRDKFERQDAQAQPRVEQREQFGHESGGVTYETRIPVPVIRDPKAPPPIIPSCSTATLVCDSVSASLTKCGYPEYAGFVSTPPKIYKQKDQTGTDTSSLSCEISHPGNTCSFSRSGSGSRQAIYSDGVGVCTLTDPSSGGTYSWSYGACGSGIPPSPGSSSWAFFELTPTSATTAEYHSSVTFPSGGVCEGWTVATDTYQTISDEYTTAELKAKTIAKLPAFDGDFDDSCSAVANLSSSESSYTLTRVQYKFVFDTPACAGMSVKWSEQFIPTLTANVTYSGTVYHAGSPDPDPSHWTVIDSEWIAVGDETETPVFTMADPANGTKTVVNVVVDCTDCVPEE